MWPRWRRDASELFYLSSAGRLMSVPIVRHGADLETGTPVALFTLRSTSGYEASPDGQRFLVNMLLENVDVKINVVHNWQAGSKK